MQPKDFELNKDLILDSNLGKTITSTKTEQVFNILSSKLKSNNLFIKLNFYESLIGKSNQEASDFRTRWFTDINGKLVKFGDGVANAYPSPNLTKVITSKGTGKTQVTDFTVRVWTYRMLTPGNYSGYYTVTLNY